jgi:hypothetical protein
MTFPTYYILPFIIGLLLDLGLSKYQYTNKYLNYFLVFIMIFGHPLYFGISYIIAMIIDRNLSDNPLYNEFTYIGFIILIISAFSLALLRYRFYTFIFKKTPINMINLYEYSRFYIFTIFGIFLYLSIINMKLEFYTVYLFQMFLPILLSYLYIYMAIKLIILFSIKTIKKYASSVSK